MKNEILNKLFTSRWNYAWGRVDEHLIALFYKKGGFNGLYDYVVSEKERMNKQPNSYGGFNSYYSSDLIETLEKAKIELKDEDFREFIFNSYYHVSFNKHNFKKLEEYGLLEYFKDFSDSFRGDIQSLHQIGDYCIIETLSKKDGKRFYNKPEFSSSFDTLEQAIIYRIYGGKYWDTLLTLLNTTIF